VPFLRIHFQKGKIAVGKPLQKYLSKRQVEIMIKYYYMRCLTKVAKDENIKVYQVKSHLENGFRVMWLAYSPLFWKGMSNKCCREYQLSMNKEI